MKISLFLIFSICCTSVIGASPTIKDESNNSIDTDILKSKEMPSAKSKADEIPNPKIEAKKIALKAKQEFKYKIFSAWNPPIGSAGQKATARIILNENGTISSMMINSSDSEMKASIELAIRNAAPFPMPPNPDARDEAQRFTVVFTLK